MNLPSNSWYLTVEPLGKAKRIMRALTLTSLQKWDFLKSVKHNDTLIASGVEKHWMIKISFFINTLEKKNWLCQKSSWTPWMYQVFFLSWRSILSSKGQWFYKNNLLFYRVVLESLFGVQFFGIVFLNSFHIWWRWIYFHQVFNIWQSWVCFVPSNLADVSTVVDWLNWNVHVCFLEKPFWTRLQNLISLY